MLLKEGTVEELQLRQQQAFGQSQPVTLLVQQKSVRHDAFVLHPSDSVIDVHDLKRVRAITARMSVVCP